MPPSQTTERAPHIYLKDLMKQVKQLAIHTYNANSATCYNRGDQTLSLSPPFSSPRAVPDLGWYQFPPGAEFTVAPRIDTPLPPTDNASPIGPVGTMMHIKLACCDIRQLQSQLHRSITREVYIVQGQCVHNDVPMCMWGGGGGVVRKPAS